jgi:PAS domain S-box-containing protein
MGTTHPIQGAMETSFITTASAVHRSDILNIIVGSNTISLDGAWSLQPYTSASKINLNEFSISFDYLINLNNTNNLIHPDDLAHVQHLINDLHRTKSIQYTFRIITPSGEIKTLSGHGKVMWQNHPGSNTKKTLAADWDENLNVRELQFKILECAEQIGSTGSWAWNIERDDVYFSDNIYRINGLEPQSIPAGLETFSVFIHPEDLPEVKEVVRLMYKSVHPINVEYRIYRADTGELRYLRALNEHYVTESGSNYIIGTVQDITDQKKAAIELQEKELLIKQVIATTPDILYLMDVATANFTYVNNRITKLLGYTPEYINNLKSEAVRALVHPEDYPALELHIKNLVTIRDGEIREIEYRMHDIYQHWHWFKVRETIFKRDNKGNVLQVIGSTHEVTEQKLIEQKFQKQKILLQKTLDAIPQMVWVFDVHGKTNFFNDRWYTFTGLSEVECEHFNSEKSKAFHPSQKAELSHKWNDCIKNGIPYSGEILIKNRNGEFRWHLDLTIPLKDDSGKVEMWVVTYTDVHEQFNTEKKLQESHGLLQTIFNTSINGIQIFDCVYNDEHDIIDFRWKYLNKTSKEFIRTGDPTGRRLLADYPGLVKSGIFEKYKNVAKTGKSIQFEQLYNFDGFNNWLHIAVSKLEDGIVVSFQDITERKKADIELQETKHFIQQIADSTPDIIYVLDVESKKITYINNRFHEVFGIAETQLLNKDLTILRKIVHEDDHEQYTQYMNHLSVLNDTEIRKMEIRLKVNNGSWRWFLVRDRVFKRTTEGLVSQTIGLLQDITEIKEANEKIILQHQIDRQAEKIAHIGNWQWHLQTGELLWAENIYQLLELEPGNIEPTLETFIAAIHPDDQQSILKQCLDVIHSADCSSLLFNYRVLKKDGGIRYLSSSGQKITHNNGPYVIGTVRDVTQEILTQWELNNRIKFTETLIESSVDRLMSINKDLQFLLWNKKCEEVYGLPKEQVLGKHLFEIFPEFETNEFVMQCIKNSFAGKLMYLPAQLRISDESYCEGYFIPLTNDDQEVYAALAVLHEITDKIKAQHELEILNDSLKQKNHELNAMNEELSTFAFVASHDLREPLRKIQVFSQALLQKEASNFSTQGKDFFTRILSAVHRMNLLIDDILTFSRISADSKEFIDVDLNHILTEVKNDLKDVIQRKGATIESNLLPVYRCNPMQFTQLLQNLLHNALKFHTPGNIPHIVISTEIIHGKNIDHPLASPRKKYLNLQISDNGIGFEKEYETKIFQMFQRLHGIGEYPGTGMGLAICKKVAESHKGFIVADGNPGKGAIFSCYFPL